MFKNKKLIIYFTLLIFFLVGFIIMLSFGFLHLHVWYTQPRFIDITTGTVTSSAGFLIEFLLFLGFSLLPLAGFITFLILYLRNYKNANKKTFETD